MKWQNIARSSTKKNNKYKTVNIAWRIVVSYARENIYVIFPMDVARTYHKLRIGTCNQEDDEKKIETKLNICVITAI